MIDNEAIHTGIFACAPGTHRRSVKQVEVMHFLNRRGCFTPDGKETVHLTGGDTRIFDANYERHMGSRRDDGKGLHDFISAAMAGPRYVVAPRLDGSHVSYAFVGVAELRVRSHACMNHFLRFNMASGDRKNTQTAKSSLSDAALIDLSLRNHLSLYALRSEHGAAFHLGTIIRTMFASFYLFDAGFGDGKLSIYTDADISLCQLATSRGYSLGPQALQATAQLLELYDTQLRTAPLDELIAAHQRAERNFKASSDGRLSIPALVQRCRRRPQKDHSMDSTITS